MPDVRSFAAGGYVPATGMIYIVAGYNTGDVTSSQNTTWQYDPVLDTWTDLTATDPYPHAAGGFGYGVINDKLYVAGGRDAALNIINDTYEFDPQAAAGSRYTKRPTNLVHSRITFLAARVRKACCGSMVGVIPLLPDRKLTQA